MKITCNGCGTYLGEVCGKEPNIEKITKIMSAKCFCKIPYDTLKRIVEDKENSKGELERWITQQLMAEGMEQSRAENVANICNIGEIGIEKAAEELKRRDDMKQKQKHKQEQEQEQNTNKKGKKIYWLSRHDILPAQMEELKKVFGDDMTLIHDRDSFSDSKDIVDRFNKSGADELVIVAPLYVIYHVLQMGIKPIKAFMTQKETFTDPNRESIVNGRVHAFIKFQRILRIDIVSENL